MRSSEAQLYFKFLLARVFRAVRKRSPDGPVVGLRSLSNSMIMKKKKYRTLTKKEKNKGANKN